MNNSLNHWTFIFVCLACIKVGMAQAYPLAGPANEVKFNAGSFLATGTIELGYEHYLNKDVSLGGTVYWDNDPGDYNGDFGIGPALRAYFGYQPRSGFFAEAFGSYARGEEAVSEGTAPPLTERYDSFALGLGVGSKWATRSQRFTLEIFGGLGRNLNPEPFQDTFIYRAGLSVGFRF
jgi:hypothetical protein